jgi:hypothetical protein
MATCCRLDPDAYEDLLSEVFLDVWRQADRLKVALPFDVVYFHRSL